MRTPGCRTGSSRRHDLGVRYVDNPAEGSDDRDRRLSTTRNHIKIGGVDIDVQIDGWTAIWADRRGCPIDRTDARLRVTRSVRRVSARIGGLEHHARARYLVEQPIDAFGARLQPKSPCAREAIGRRIDTDHVARLDELAAPSDLNTMSVPMLPGPTIAASM